MNKSILEKAQISDEVVELAERLTGRVPWPERRQAMADVTVCLLGGSARTAEEVFGWSRTAVVLGLHELRAGIVCVNDLSARRKPTTEEKHPLLLEDIRGIMDAASQAQSHLRTPFSYTHMSAKAVRLALLKKGWLADGLPGVRTLSNILNRQDYRLRRVEKTRVQKKRHSPTLSSRT